MCRAPVSSACVPRASVLGAIMCVCVLRVLPSARGTCCFAIPAARLVQALVLTHEDSEKEYMNTYLHDSLKPVRPWLSYGRAAKRDPVTKVKLAVWSWWQDLRRHSTVIHACLFVCCAPRQGMLVLP